ncbi:MAG: hypothetical protein IPO60_11940 [Flavobacteriales bacterium]|nr:hypothetical protein [Flavobacteriales bacterium]
MKPAIAILSLFLAIPCCNAQTPKEKFITYSLQIERAETAAAHGKHAQAMDTYDSAFALLPFMGYDYFDAVVNALKAGSDERANELLIQGTENGLILKGQYDSTLHSFLQSERCMPYLNMQDYMRARWLSHADTVLMRKLRNVGSWYVMVEDSSGNTVQVTDSSAFVRLMALVKESGWPTPLTVGSDFYRAQSLLFNQLYDYPASPKWQQILPYIQTAMNRGALPPDFLAPFQDMADIDKGKPTTYGVMLAFYSEDPSKWDLVDRATLNKNRASIGLGPVEDFAFRYNIDLSNARFAEP